jgi:ABC-type sugar transport system substrate-binding protein
MIKRGLGDMVRKKSISAIPVLLALVTFGCGTSSAPTSSTGPLAGKTVWYMDILKSNASLNAVAQGMNHVIVADGGKMVETYAQTESGGIDASLEAQNMQRAIAVKPAGIAYFELDPKLLKPQVAQAIQAGIPTFGVQGMPDGFQASGWIDFDNTGNGIALAKRLALAMPPGGKFTVIAPPNTGTVQLVTTNGISTLQSMGFTLEGSLEQQRDVTDDAAGGQKVMQAVLQKYPDLSGVLAYNDGAALGAISAIKAAGLQKKIFVTGRNGGDDGIGAVKSGDMLATCSINAVAVGEAVGQAIADQVSGKATYANNKAIPNPPPLGFSTTANGGGACIIDSSNVSSYKTYTQQITYVTIPTQ